MVHTAGAAWAGLSVEAEREHHRGEVGRGDGVAHPAGDDEGLLARGHDGGAGDRGGAPGRGADGGGHAALGAEARHPAAVGQGVGRGERVGGAEDADRGAALLLGQLVVGDGDDLEAVGRDEQTGARRVEDGVQRLLDGDVARAAGLGDDELVVAPVLRQRPLEPAEGHAAEDEDDREREPSDDGLHGPVRLDLAAAGAAADEGGGEPPLAERLGLDEVLLGGHVARSEETDGEGREGEEGDEGDALDGVGDAPELDPRAGQDEREGDDDGGRTGQPEGQQGAPVGVRRAPLTTDATARPGDARRSSR